VLVKAEVPISLHVLRIGVRSCLERHGIYL